MNIIHWVIIGLVVISFIQYVAPEKINDKLAYAYDPVKDMFNIDRFTNKEPVQNSICPETINPVCAEGITYNNACLAALDGKLQITMGACNAES